MSVSLHLLLGHRDRTCFSGPECVGLAVPVIQKMQMLGNESQLPDHCWSAHVLIYGERGKMRPARTDGMSQ